MPVRGNPWEGGAPECALTWRGPKHVLRFLAWMGHPDRLAVEREGGRWRLVDAWTGESQRLEYGCVVVVERGGKAVVV